MKCPRITVIINSYNYGSYIGEAIDSVVNQDYENKQIVVVDDGSTDNSKDIITAYGDLVEAHFHSNMGQARSCLKVARLATGDYIQFLDSDDFLLPHALTSIANHCGSEVSKIQFQLRPVNSHSDPIGPAWPKMTAAGQDHLIQSIERTGTYVSPPNSGNVYRADVLRLITDIDYETSIDGIPYLLAPLLGRVEHIGRPLGCYRYHSQNFSGHGQLKAARFRLEAQRHADRLRHLRDIADSNNLPLPTISDADDHAFVLTRQILSSISDGDRPSGKLVHRYLNAIWREREGLKRTVQLALWGIAARISPNRLRRWLALYRSDPTSR